VRRPAQEPPHERCPAPPPRRIGAALDVLLALPPAVLAALAERLIDRLDALDPDADSEPDDDGEADQDGEAAPWDDDVTWTPTTGPAECCAVRAPG